MPAPNSRLSFVDWLSLQHGGSTVAASDAQNVDDESARVSTSEPRAHLSSTQKPFRLLTSLPDCRAERRNIIDSKGQQDIQLTLLPPPHIQAGPLNISLEQVDRLLPHLSEPLISMHVGELSRSLFPNPKQLAATGEAGVLQLWLTAASMLNIVWVHRRQHMPFSAQAAGSGMRDVWMQTTQVLASLPCMRPGMPGPQPHVTAWRLEQDASGRSFCLQLDGLADQQAGSEHLHQQWYFWARTEGDKQKMSRMLSLLRSPPSLSALSGVKQAKLDEIAAWTLHAHQSLATPSPGQSNSSAPSASSALPSSSTVDQALSSQPDPLPAPLRNPAVTAAHPPAAERRGTAASSNSSSSSRADELAADDTNGNTPSGTIPSAHAPPAGHPEDAVPVHGRMNHVQVTAVQGATASAYMTEPAWGIAQTLRVQVKAGICLAGSSQVTESAGLLNSMMARGALLAKQQADASAKQEAARLGWRRLEALAAQKAVTALHKPKQMSGSRQVQCSVEALRRRLKLSDRRRCRDHPSRHAQHCAAQAQDALHEATENVPHSQHKEGPKRCTQGLNAGSGGESCTMRRQQAACSDTGLQQEGEDAENIAPGTRVDLNTLDQLLH